MTQPWPLVKLGEVLRTVERPVAIDSLTEYRLLGVRWYGNGFFTKDVKLGQEIAATRLYRVCKGDFVYNRLFAWKGSFAIAGEEADGCFVSNEFPCFATDPARVEAKFLGLWFRQESSWLRALGLSTGATPTSRNRLKESAFLSLQVPLPPLAQQQRLVAHIEALANQLSEAQRLRNEVAQERNALCRSVFATDTEVQLVPMADLVALRTLDVVVRPDETYQFAGVYSFGRGVFRAQTKTGVEFAYPKLTTLKTGNFTYPKLMAWEGALGIVPAECDGCVVSTEFPVFEVDESRVLPEVLDVHFRNPAVWPDLSGASTGTNVRRRRLNPQDFLKYRMPVPSRRVQLQLRQIMHEMSKLHSISQLVSTELDALLPAVLDKAFKGELL